MVHQSTNVCVAPFSLLFGCYWTRSHGCCISVRQALLNASPPNRFSPPLKRQRTRPTSSITCRKLTTLGTRVTHGHGNYLPVYLYIAGMREAWMLDEKHFPEYSGWRPHKIACQRTNLVQEIVVFRVPSTWLCYAIVLPQPNDEVGQEGTFRHCRVHQGQCREKLKLRHDNKGQSRRGSASAHVRRISAVVRFSADGGSDYASLWCRAATGREDMTGFEKTLWVLMCLGACAYINIT